MNNPTDQESTVVSSIAPVQIKTKDCIERKYMWKYLYLYIHTEKMEQAMDNATHTQ